MIGMSAWQLSRCEGQMSLFADPKNTRQKRMDAVADQIAAKFGSNALRR
jgi:putative ubiquitin-RnfH superfamily antitoxin RatB of RatAB toxin-antitoxin module